MSDSILFFSTWRSFFFLLLRYNRHIILGSCVQHKDFIFFGHTKFQRMQRNITDYSHPAVCYISMTSIFYDWKFLPLEPLHSYLLSLPSGNYQFVLCIYEFGFILFCLLFVLLFRFHILSEIIWYLSVSDLFHLA